MKFCKVLNLFVIFGWHNDRQTHRLTYQPTDRPTNPVVQAPSRSKMTKPWLIKKPQSLFFNKNECKVQKCYQYKEHNRFWEICTIVRSARQYYNIYRKAEQILTANIKFLLLNKTVPWPVVRSLFTVCPPPLPPPLPPVVIKLKLQQICENFRAN